MPGVCSRCDLRVHVKEEKLAFGKVWHTSCFSCRNCRKLLNGCTVATYCGELFCKNCYLSRSASKPKEIKTFSDLLPAAFSCDSLTSCSCCRCCTDDCCAIDTSDRKEIRSAGRRRCGEGKEEKPDHPSDQRSEKRGDESQSSDAVCNFSSPVSVTTCCNRHPASQIAYGQPASAKEKTFPPSNAPASELWPEPVDSGNGSVVSENCNEKCLVSQKTDLRWSARRQADCNSNSATSNLSTDGNRAVSISHERRAKASCGSVCKSNDAADIPSKEELSRVPLPPPRSPLPSRRRVSFRESVSKIHDGSHSATARNFRARLFREETSDSRKTVDVWRADEEAAKSDCEHENASDFARALENDLSTYDLAQSTLDNESEDSCLNNNHQSSLDDIENNEHRMRGGCDCCVCTRESELCDNTLTRENRRCECCSEFCDNSQMENYENSADRDSNYCGDTIHSEKHCRFGLGCKKAKSYCRSFCTAEKETCSGGGCCRGCGKQDKICMSTRSSATPPCRVFPRIESSCPPCCLSQQTRCRNTRNTGSSVPLGRAASQELCCMCGEERIAKNCCRSRSPKRAVGIRGYFDNGARIGTDSNVRSPCRTKLLCECLGGGLDCRRCGRKVYQAEMQMVSGVPYHSICFSCFCCRKPLEPLTYQENSGEIYCKQCYVRNFGPQGYGYGVGAGVLQTPI